MTMLIFRPFFKKLFSIIYQQLLIMVAKICEFLMPSELTKAKFAVSSEVSNLQAFQDVLKIDFVIDTCNIHIS